MLDNKKNILLGVLVVGVIAMTVAFAALSTSLRISGTASVPDTRWNIHFVSQSWATDTQSKVTVGTNEQDNTAEFPTVEQLQKSLSPNITLVEGLNVTLKQPGDYAKYKFNIINEGTIDAELSSFSAPMTCTVGNNCDDVINYEVKCYYNQDFTGSELTTHSVLEKTNGTAYCYLKVEYKDKTNQNSGTAGNAQTYSQNPIKASLSASWQWIQKTENGQSGSNSGNEQGNNEPVTPNNPYETTFNENYIAYTWTEGINGDQAAGSYNNRDDWNTSLDSNVKAYVRTDGSIPEICGVFGSGQSGTVCMTSSYYNGSYSDEGGYYSDFEDCETGIEPEIYDGSSIICIKGYAKAKADEMLSKGASSCTVDLPGDDAPSIECYTDEEYRTSCRITNDGLVSCSASNSSGLYIYGDAVNNW